MLAPVQGRQWHQKVPFANERPVHIQRSSHHVSTCRSAAFIIPRLLRQQPAKRFRFIWEQGHLQTIGPENKFDLLGKTQKVQAWLF
jgi:hypothetical protein